MENPLSNPDSQPESLNEPATDNTSLGLNEAVKLNEPQVIAEAAEENRPQDLDKETKDLNVPAAVGKPLIVVEPPKESSHKNLHEQAKDSEPQDQPAQDHRLQDLNETHEDSKRTGLNQVPSVSTTQDLESDTEAQSDVSQKTLLEKEEFPLPSSSEGEEITPTDDVTAPKPSSDDNAQGLEEPDTDNPPQTLSVPINALQEEPERYPPSKKKAPSWITTTGQKKKEKVAETPSSYGTKRCFHPCGHGSLSSKPMYSGSPTQLAKAALRPKPKPQTADKATQILPGRVPMLSKLPPKTAFLPAKPKPPSADKGTEISPSFEKLLKRPPPLVMKKKKKKEEINPATIPPVCSHGTGSPKKQLSFSSHRGRPPRTASNRPLPRVKSSRSGPLHATSSKSGPLRAKSPRVKRSRSSPLRVKKSKSGPLRVRSWKSRPPRVKSSRSMPLCVKLSSSSPSKHRLNLSYCSRKDREIVCNFYLTFCDNWEEPEPCCHLQGNHWEECLSSCSGLYRACSVFRDIKYGRIHVSNLLLALHMLGILVTSEEMHCILHLVSVDGHGSLNFCQFLEAVNTSSPFAETDAFQNTLQAFRKMKKGTVTVEELEPILHYLGITLSSEILQQTLGRTKVNKNGKFDISDFLLAAKELQRSLDEEEEALLYEYAISKRSPFEDVADLVDAEYRRRRKYWDCFDEEMPVHTCLLPLLMCQESDEDVALGKQQSKTSNMDVRRSSTASTKEEVKEGDAMEVTSSSPGSLANNAKEGNKDSDAMELGKSQAQPPAPNTGDPVPS